MLQVQYSPHAFKDLANIGPIAETRIRRKIDAYAANPQAFANRVEKLQGRPGFRLRVGDYRVLFAEQGVVITVLTVGHRREVYR